MKLFDKSDQKFLKAMKEDLDNVLKVRDKYEARVERLIARLRKKYQPVTLEEHKQLGYLMPDSATKVLYFHEILMREKQGELK